MTKKKKEEEKEEEKRRKRRERGRRRSNRRRKRKTRKGNGGSWLDNLITARELREMCPIRMVASSLARSLARLIRQRKRNAKNELL